MEKIPQYCEDIQELNKKLFVQLNLYSENKRTEFYSPNFNYENYEDEIIVGESVLDCLYENKKRNECIMKLMEEEMIKINYIRNKMIKLIKNQIKENAENLNKISKTIESLNKITKQEENKENKNDKEEIEKIKKENEKFEKEMKKYSINKWIKYMMEFDEYKKIKEWTNKQLGKVLFDSNVDDWNINTTTLHEKIMNKEKILFVVEDEENNKFGGYLNSKIDKVFNCDGNIITDSTAFVFSL